jgi:hypothetical protein
MEYLYETHMHTSEVSGCADSSAIEQVYDYKKRGYTGIIVTDHFINGYSTCPRNLPWDKKMVHIVSGYVAAKKAGDECGLDVFLGWEFTVRGSDLLTYGLDLDFLVANPNLDKLSVEAYSTLVHRCGGFLAQAHPYRDAPYIEYKFPVEPQFLDAIEVYNPFEPRKSNEKAFAFAKRHDLPMQVGSDSHNVYAPHYCGIRLRNRAESIFDIIEAIRSKDITIAK